MPRTIARSEKMSERMVLRCTPSDIAALRLAAQNKGLDVSALVRMLLIKERILEPLG